MYHGTRPDAAESIERYGFSRSIDGMLGGGVYLSRDVTKASCYPLSVDADDHDNRVILECLVHVGKVKRIDSANHPMQKTWMILGYDTAWVPPHCGMVPSGLEEDCVWDTERIIVLRRVQVEQAAKAAAVRRAAAAQASQQRARASKASVQALVGAASGGKGVPMQSTSATSKPGSATRDGRVAGAVEAGWEGSWEETCQNVKR